MAVEDVVIAYRANIDDVRRKVKTLQNVNKLLAQELGSDFVKGATVVKSELTKITTLAKGVKLPLGGISKNAKTFTTVLRGANGQLATVTKTVAGTGKNIKVLNETVRRGATVGRTFGDNLKTLGKRALLTIPIWFGLRTAIFGVFRTIRDGLKNLADFDRALQKLSRNISASSTNISADFERVQKTVTQFSLDTGKSVEEITNAIQKFATVGFDLETSLTGGLQATKLAITLFGDVEETAQAFARSLRVLTEDIDSTEEKQKAIAEALALTDQLWQTNAFEINEFSQNLTKFAGTANIANLSIEDTLTLLATLSTGGLANRAGRLLRSTLLRALQDIDKVTRALELDFDPNNQPTIEFILALVERLQELRTVGNIPQELAEILGELFTVRSTEVVASLVSLEETLKENIALRPDLEKFEDTFEAQLKAINRLVERHKNLNREIGKAFVSGLLGAGNYQKSLEVLVETQEGLIDDINELGGVIRNTFISIGVGSLVRFGQVVQTQIVALGTLRTILLQIEGILLTKLPIALATGLLAFTGLTLVDRVNKGLDELEQTELQAKKIGQQIQQQLKEGIEGDLTLDELENLISQLETFGTDQLQTAFNITLPPNLLQELKVIRDEQRKITQEKEKQKKLDEESKVIETDRKQLAEAILENQLETLRRQGALNSELNKTESILRKTLNIQESDVAQVIKKIQLQRELNDEKELESKLSERTQKLAEIARTEGVQTATRIGEVLRGEFDFDLFERIGGRDLEVFKREFGDLFNELQDIKFLQEKGFNIPIALEDEFTVRGNTGRIRTQALLEEQRAKNLLKTIQSTDSNTNATRLLSERMKRLSEIIDRTVSLSPDGRITSETAQIINEARRQIQAGQQPDLFQAIQEQSRIQREALFPRGRPSERVQEQPTRPVSQTRTVAFNINFSGRNVRLSGATPEETLETFRRAEPRIFELFKDQIRQLILDEFDEQLGDGTVVQ